MICCDRGGGGEEGAGISPTDGVEELMHGWMDGWKWLRLKVDEVGVTDFGLDFDGPRSRSDLSW